MLWSDLRTYSSVVTEDFSDKLLVDVVFENDSDRDLTESTKQYMLNSQNGCKWIKKTGRYKKNKLNCRTSLNIEETLF
jgi:cytochrome oxidase Cu insertion factor (SCO1/SenC/PrrC family)